MDSKPERFSYQSMGTSWEVSIWDEIDPTVYSSLQKTIIEKSELFDQTYSRFKKTSLVWQLTKKLGITEVPKDLVKMLRLYEKLNTLSEGILNPFIGFSLADLGYDDTYSLKPKKEIRPVPNFTSALTIIDETHIELKESVLIDLGALGKGYFVDVIATLLKQQGIQRFLVNGSGDMYYSGNGIPLRAGLEDPSDPTKVIGVLELTEGALCASAGNRRAWDKYNHTINPNTLTSPDKIIATWVLADTAAIADGLCTCLFMTEPECFDDLHFEYCLLNPAYAIKRSAGFQAELF